MKPVKLRMTWHGEEPIPGQYLATKNGRTAYLILEVVRPTKPSNYTFKAICERRPRMEADRYKCWQFRWNKR